MIDEPKTKEQLNSELVDEDENPVGAVHVVRDITERKRSAEALAKSEALIRELVEASPVGILYLDASGTITYENPAMLRMMGVPEGMDSLVVGSKIAEIPPIKEAGILPLLDRCRAGEAVVGEVVHYRSLMGVEVDLEVHAAPLMGAQGQWEGAIVMTHDITEHKRAEDVLRESEEKYRTLVENANEIILVAQDGMLKFANPKATEVTGYLREELTSRSFVEFIHPDDRKMVAERYQARLRGKRGEGLPDVYSFRTIDKDGNVKWLEIRTVLITWEGRPATLNFLSDITERKQAAEALAKSEALTRELVEASPVGILYLDASGTITYENPAMLRMMGVPEGMEPLVVGKKIAEIPPIKEAGILPLLDRCQSGETIVGEVVHYRSLMGVEVDLEVHAAPLMGAQGQWEGAIVMTHDITERKQAEEALKEYTGRLEEMVEERTKELRDAQEQLIRREKLAMLGQLAGGVAHELRNPLATISNAAYYLKIVLPDAAETVKEYLEIIAGQVHESDRIISDLLDFSRNRVPYRERIALSALVADVLVKHSPPENVEVVTEIPDLPPVYADPRQMRQVLVNLVANAYQAMSEGGTLTISAQTREGAVALSVTDTGMGISEDIMAKIFEPLFTTRAKGLGLGLTVVKMLVEANEGSIEVESDEGKGSTFTAFLPAM